MLVLTRKIGEAVVIGGGIVVRVLDARPGRVRLGFVTPDDVLVLRSEVAARLELSTEVVEQPRELAHSH